MPHIRQNLSLPGAVAAQAIRDDLARLVLEADQQTLEEPLGGGGIATHLDENVEHDTVLVHGAPEMEELADDRQVHLILSANSGRRRQSYETGHPRPGRWQAIEP